MHDSVPLAWFSRQARRAVLCVVATVSMSASGFGCSTHDRPSRPPPMRGVGPVLQTVPLRSPPASTDLTDPREFPEQNQAMPAAAAAPSDEDNDKKKEKRDFSAELVRAFGDPASCLQPRTSDTGPGQLPIALSTQVMPSGMVADSSVSAPGLSPDEVKCLRQRLESVHFAQPIENAPFRVTGSMTLARSGGATRATARVEEKKREDKADKPQDPWQEPAAPAPVEQNTDYIEPQPAAAIEKIAAPRYEDPWKEPVAPPPVAQNTEPGEP